MPIGVFTMVGIYIIAWWTVLFAVLPLGTASETHEPPTDGSQWGAPKTPNLKKKFLTTTWVSAIIFVIVFAVIQLGIIPMPSGPANF